MNKEPMNLIKKSQRDTRRLNMLLFMLIGLVELMLLALIFYVTYTSFKSDSIGVYNVVAINVMLIWVGMLIGYYTWAVYFYNINLGLTNEDWAEIREKKARGQKVVEPTKNPHSEQTLGLPDGTIRGTLALSLAIGAIAMLVASLNRDTTYPANAIFIDAFDFFKTAFLMMIAFYFGNKSLENLKGLSTAKTPAETTEQRVEPVPVPITLPPATNPETADLRKKLNEENLTREEEILVGEKLGILDDSKAKG